MSNKQLCTKCHRTLSLNNFVGKSGKPLKTCQRCRAGKGCARQDVEEQAYENYEDVSESESAESSSESESESESEEEDIVCQHCNRNFGVDYNRAAKHVSSKEHLRNTGQE